MKINEKTNRYAPFVEIDRLDELFKLRVASDTPKGHDLPQYLYLDLPRGAKPHECQLKIPYVEPTPELLDVIRGLTIYAFTPLNVAMKHMLALHITPHGSVILCMRFQHIIGTHAICEVPEAEYEALLVQIYGEA